MQATEETTAIIIGSGPAGLAMAACLQREGVPYVVLERETSLAPAWRKHYQRLHLHTVKKHSALPFRPYPKSYPKYPSRLQFIEYLEGYAEAFNIRPRFGSRVVWAGQQNGSWCARTETEAYNAQHLIVATGYNGQPYFPEIDGLRSFEGTVLHSSDYKTGADYKGKKVLVVGCGNSGAEIAVDLHEQGAQAWMVVRGPAHVVPRDLLGTPIQVSAIMLNKLPTAVADAITGLLLKATLGDLSPYGIVRPEKGPRAMIEEEGRVPILDIGLIDLVKKGQIQVMPGISQVGAKEVTFEDGQVLPFDVIVLATGYRPQLQAFLEGAEEVLDERGYPRAQGYETEAPGLHFVGFSNPVTGLLREIGIDAKRIAAAIRKKELV